MRSTTHVDLGFLTEGAGLYEPDDSLPDGARRVINGFDQVLLRGYWLPIVTDDDYDHASHEWFRAAKDYSELYQSIHGIHPLSSLEFCADMPEGSERIVAGVHQRLMRSRWLPLCQVGSPADLLDKMRAALDFYAKPRPPATRAERDAADHQSRFAECRDDPLLRS